MSNNHDGSSFGKSKRSNQRKRSYHNHNTSSSERQYNLERRGGPAVLLTCEHGREVKCEREGMDILQYYINLSKNKQSIGTIHETTTSQVQMKNNCKSSPALGFDQELESLQRQNKDRSRGQYPDLAVYDTGCKGMVLILCTLPDCHLVPAIVTEKNLDEYTSKKNEASSQPEINQERENRKTVESNTGQVKKSQPRPLKEEREHGKIIEPTTSQVKKRSIKDEQNQPNKRNKTLITTTVDSIHQNTMTVMEKLTQDDDFVPNPNGWDPVPVVTKILREAAAAVGRNNNREAPSSRFVLRTIPLQATCFASMDAIIATARALMRRLLHDMKSYQASSSEDNKTNNETQQQQTTFSIHVKKRYCGHLTSKGIIESLGSHAVALMAPSWTVNLTNPTVKIWIEICRTTAGLSIFRVDDLSDLHSNFNLAETKAKVCDN